MAENKFKVIQYSKQGKDDSINFIVLEKILKEIWKTLGELSQKTNLKFQKLTMLSEVDQIDLLCAYIVRKFNVGN